VEAVLALLQVEIYRLLVDLEVMVAQEVDLQQQLFMEM
jgi:hypothetical protein